MKTTLILLLLSTSLYAQTSEEARLRKENEELKQKIQLLESQQKTSPEDEAKARQIMETLKKGQKFQEEQNKALEELDREL